MDAKVSVNTRALMSQEIERAESVIYRDKEGAIRSQVASIYTGFVMSQTALLDRSIPLPEGQTRRSRLEEPTQRDVISLQM
jgi:hypothetical protein